MKMILRWASSVASIKKFGEKPSPPVPSPPNYSMPRPHPIKMNETSAEIISYKIPNRPLTPLYEIPFEARVQLFPYFTSPADSKSIKVALIGAPNAGKTSFLNTILGERYFAVTRKANTTFQVQEGIKTIDNTQIIFHDTPGIISSHGILTNKISTRGWQVIQDCQLTLFIVDAVKMLQNDVRAACSRLQSLLSPKGKKLMPEAQIAGESPEQYQQRLSQAPVTIPACLIVNKVDLVKERRSVKYLVNELREYAKFAEHFFISSKENYNIDEVVKYICSQAEPGMWEYNPLQKTNLPDIEIAADVVREQVMNRIHEELPYRWIYTVYGWTPYLDGSLRIDVNILVKSNIHKGILIGKDAMVIKKIAYESEIILSNIYKRRVVLVIDVKIMDKDIRKASYKGLHVTVPHPRLPKEDTISGEQLKRLDTET
ncbi:hypothetical protein SteCoe_36780 [Stentor coeruleus]|uniref:KH type-2 domain-containing protein n=1 Tax=Stentor coeruleus TaxID=5963 RepID=A0A1R2APC2_9CILI|nr:hypothetical protein SteCoe_36780 [Stentor coeruleus]